MKVTGIKSNQNFGATLPYSDFQKVVQHSVDRCGMSKRLASFLVNRIHKYFPSKDYYVSMNDYVSDEKLRRIMCCTTVERKLPTNHDPDKSLYKTIFFEKPRSPYEKWGWDENTLYKFVQSVKELSKKDWSFENNLKKGTQKEHFYM